MAGDSVKALEPGAILARRYRVSRCIKAGGMGAVYEVRDLKTKRRLALKTVRPGVVPSASLLARFEQEASITGSIDSEHIVKVEDAGVDEETGTAFLTMELLVGRDLDAVLREDGPLLPTRVAKLLWQVGLALAAVHDAGIVHRDIKPENLFLTPRDSGEELVKILDFGVAKLTASDPRATAFVGTPLYMPPEQIRGEHPDPRADTYALAQVAFALLTGHAYLEPGNVRESATRRAERYQVKLPEAFDRWFGRATADDVAARFETAVDLVAELGAVLGVDLAAPRRRASRALVSTSSAPPVERGIRTAVGSADGSLDGAQTGGDSVGGISSARPRSLIVGWRGIVATAVVGVLGVAVVLFVARWSASPHSPPARSPGVRLQARSVEVTPKPPSAAPIPRETPPSPVPVVPGPPSVAGAREAAGSTKAHPVRREAPAPRRASLPPPLEDDLLSRH